MRDFTAQLGTRRALILSFVLVVLLGALFATNTFSSKTQKAQAGSCFAQTKNWALQGGDVPLTIGTASFGATICLDNFGNIASASPFLNGGIEGAGTTSGFDMSNQGAWVVSKTPTTLVVQGQSKIKSCIPGFGSIVCSLTDTETYTLRYSTVYGPYPPGTEPGIFFSSQTCDLSGGCYPAITAVER